MRFFTEACIHAWVLCSWSARLRQQLNICRFVKLQASTQSAAWRRSWRQRTPRSSQMMRLLRICTKSSSLAHMGLSPRSVSHPGPHVRSKRHHRTGESRVSAMDASVSCLDSCMLGVCNSDGMVVIVGLLAHISDQMSRAGCHEFSSTGPVTMALLM